MLWSHTSQRSNTKTHLWDERAHDGIHCYRARDPGSRSNQGWEAIHTSICSYCPLLLKHSPSKKATKSHGLPRQPPSLAGWRGGGGTADSQEIVYNTVRRCEESSLPNTFCFRNLNITLIFYVCSWQHFTYFWLIPNSPCVWDPSASFSQEL